MPEPNEVVVENTPPTFTDEQRNQVNQLIEGKITSLQTKHQAEIDRIKAEAAAERQAAIDAAVKEKEKSSGKLTDAEREEMQSVLNREKTATEAQKKAREAAEEKYKNLETENYNIRKDQALTSAISNQDAFNFVDVNIVKVLTDKYVSWDDDAKTYVVKDDNGAVRQNSSLQPMTLKEFFTEFGMNHPYLVASRVKNGSGSGESARTNGGTLKPVSAKTDLKTTKEKSDYINKFGGEAYEKLPWK